uniref:Inositol-1-monophosphatase n=1 Tax=Candidatus Kentrum sp. TUN TaxID=2126343 RepID=A0A451A820_9GAMM|nr:MAG: myo-inositol-1(or 4)-monophosphatase [Candidatus Kentron sp. TUN]VFK58219.1 MAG: myo-inositol-1(or 4)-monophosphatase [Candidatus Kentron sp. TUN]VFK62158.1 MAG: myo-inositol-1(or 4)-monophosphatase [Candidatus Kentron sp. TUN]
MHAMLNIGIRAARAAGNIIVRYLDRVDRRTIGKKSFNEFVDQVGKQAEQVIIDTLLKAYPNHGIFGKEDERKGNDYIWIINSLNSTTNYIHGFPQFSVSIALAYKERLDQAVIYDPLREELFTATRGENAKLNDRRIRVSRCNDLGSALLGSGFPSRNFEQIDGYLSICKAFLTASAGIRQSGSVVLDLASVAAGRFDGFWKFGLKPRDMAAGALLIQEAGGIVGDLRGTDKYIKSGNIITGNPKIHDAMMQVIRPYERFFASGTLGNLSS